MNLILVPAYGRDYETRTAMLADWRANKDFIIEDPAGGLWDGKSICRSEAYEAGIRTVNISYNKRRHITVVNVKP